MALPVNEEEGPTMILTHITTALNDLQTVTDDLNLELLIIAKTEFINNVLLRLVTYRLNHPNIFILTHIYHTYIYMYVYIVGFYY